MSKTTFLGYVPSLKAKHEATIVEGKAIESKGGSIRYTLRGEYEGRKTLPKTVSKADFEGIYGFDAKAAESVLITGEIPDKGKVNVVHIVGETELDGFTPEKIVPIKNIKSKHGLKKLMDNSVNPEGKPITEFNKKADTVGSPSPENVNQPAPSEKPFPQEPSNENFSAECDDKVADVLNYLDDSEEDLLHGGFDAFRETIERKLESENFSVEMIECGNCDETFTIDEGLDIGGIDYCEECYDTLSAKEESDENFSAPLFQRKYTPQQLGKMNEEKLRKLLIKTIRKNGLEDSFVKRFGKETLEEAVGTDEYNGLDWQNMIYYIMEAQKKGSSLEAWEVLGYDSKADMKDWQGIEVKEAFGFGKDEEEEEPEEKPKTQEFTVVLQEGDKLELTDIEDVPDEMEPKEEDNDSNEENDEKDAESNQDIKWDDVKEMDNSKCPFCFRSAFRLIGEEGEEFSVYEEDIAGDNWLLECSRCKAEWNQDGENTLDGGYTGNAEMAKGILMICPSCDETVPEYSSCMSCGQQFEAEVRYYFDDDPHNEETKGTRTFKITDIWYDTYDEEAEGMQGIKPFHDKHGYKQSYDQPDPSEMTITLDEDEGWEDRDLDMELADAVSDESGFMVYHYNWDEVKEAENYEAVTAKVTRPVKEEPKEEEDEEGMSTLMKVGLGVGALAVGAAILGAEGQHSCPHCHKELVDGVELHETFFCPSCDGKIYSSYLNNVPAYEIFGAEDGESDYWAGENAHWRAETFEASRHHGGDKKKKLMKDNYENKWKKNLNDRFNKKTIADEDLRDYKRHGRAENFSAEQARYSMKAVKVWQTISMKELDKIANKLGTTDKIRIMNYIEDNISQYSADTVGSPSPSGPSSIPEPAEATGSEPSNEQFSAVVDKEFYENVSGSLCPNCGRDGDLGHFSTLYWCDDCGNEGCDGCTDDCDCNLMEAESKNLKMALGITAVGIGLAAILGKDKLSKLFDRFNL